MGFIGSQKTDIAIICIENCLCTGCKIACEQEEDGHNYDRF
jgi:hypothetical protein